MQREHLVQWTCSRTKDERRRRTKAQRGETGCVSRLERDTSLSAQSPIGHINDRGLTETGAQARQIDSRCTKETVDQSPSAQWLMRLSLEEESVAGYRKALGRVGDMVPTKSWN